MGKQIGIYVTTNDEEWLITSLRATGDVIAVLNYTSVPDLVVVDVASLKNTMNCDGFGSMSLINKSIDSTINIDEIVPNKFSIGVSESEVIEYTRWTIIRDDGKIELGRLWYDYENMNCKLKRQVFLSWAESVFRYIRKHFHRSEDHFDRYFGPDAWEKFQKGQFTPAPY